MNRYDEVPGEDGLSKREPDVTAPESDSTWIERFKRAMKVSEDHYNTKLHTAWSRNYRAVQNRHFNGSKYDTFRYKNRSKLFKPKTRAAVRKNDATAAASLFSTEDVVSVTAERTSDKLQSTTARFLHEALNYRLDRPNKWAGPNWFLTSMGARHETQVTGICVSKQHWEYEERVVPTYVDVETQRPVLDPAGMPMLDVMTGEPMMETVVEEGIQNEIETTRDRLMITLIPSEHARIDYTGDWRDPIQDGGFFIADYPMRLDDVEDILQQNSDRNRMGGKAWRSDIDVASLRKARDDRSGSTAAGVRRARDDGQDRYEGAFRGKDHETVWLHECFYRIGGEDWHFWVLGDDTLLSDPRPTSESYPEQHGDRPYVRGLGTLEPHKTHPMAPVESWQPIQNEINDTTNLALDAMKMAISPITKYKRGSGIDLKQLQNRGPDAAIGYTTNPDEVVFDRAPDPSANSMNYVDRMSVDLDELAGVFSGSSVQSNRSLNETVGGMQLLSSSANALTEFDLRIWVETWVEPCLAQCINLIKHYESDEVVIAVAGERAGLIENLVAGEDQSAGLDPKKEEADAEKKNPFQPPITIAQVLENLDRAQVTVKVNVGIGALDSSQRMQKFMAGMKGTMELMPALEQQGITLNASAIMQELWGLVGYKDADRFFMKDEQEEGGPPPEVQLKMMDLKAKAQSDQLNAKVKVQTEKMKADLEARSISLEEREFEHRQAMDMMQSRMEQMQAQFSNGMQSQQSQLDTILKALSLAGKQQPQAPQPQR